MDSPDWRAAMARAKRLGIDAYQTGRVRWDPASATTVLVERVTSNEPWGPTSKDCAAIADLTFDAVEAPRVMEVRQRRSAAVQLASKRPRTFLLTLRRARAGHLAAAERRRGERPQELAQGA